MARFLKRFRGRIRNRISSFKSGYRMAGAYGRDRGERRSFRRRSVRNNIRGFLGLPKKINLAGLSIPLIPIILAGVYFFVPGVKLWVNKLFKK